MEIESGGNARGTPEMLRVRKDIFEKQILPFEVCQVDAPRHPDIDFVWLLIVARSLSPPIRHLCDGK
jgi:hypothetical protein